MSLIRVMLGRIDADGDCWLWLGAKTADGYGRIKFEGHNRVAHRVIFEGLMGSIPDGMQLDHLCRVPACVNPDHLEPVTPQENTDRSSIGLMARCKCGQPFDYTRSNGQRGHRACVRRIGREASRRYRESRP